MTYNVISGTLNPTHLLHFIMSGGHDVPEVSGGGDMMSGGNDVREDMMSRDRPLSGLGCIRAEFHVACVSVHRDKAH